MQFHLYEYVTEKFGKRVNPLTPIFLLPQNPIIGPVSLHAIREVNHVRQRQTQPVRFR